MILGRRIFRLSIILFFVLTTVTLAGERNPFSCIMVNYSGDNPTSEETIPFSVSFDEVAYNFNDEVDLVITETGTVAHTGASGFMGGMNFIVTILGVTGIGTMTLAVSTESDVQNEFGDPLDSSVTSVVVNINNPVEVPAVGPLGIAVLLLSLGVLLVSKKIQ